MALTDSRLTHGMIGAALGGAIGLPVRGTTPKELAGLQGYGTFDQPAGTYGDDAALALASLVAMTHGLDSDALAAAYRNYAEGRDFGATPSAPFALWPSVWASTQNRTPAAPQNDPGALARSLPLGYYLTRQYGRDWRHNGFAKEALRRFAALTNADASNRIATTIYAAIVSELLAHTPLDTAIKTSVASVLANEPDPAAVEFRTLALLDLPTVQALSAPTPRNVLARALFALQITDDFAPAVLAAAGLGGFADTTATLTGGLAGLAYGYLRIPHRWCLTLARYGDIVARVRAAEHGGFFPPAGR